MNQFDVAIVGAGPAGSSTAITLAQRGYQVALLDRAMFPRDKLCGDFLNPINWPVLDDLNVGPDLLSLPHAKVNRFRISAADGAEANSELPVLGDREFGLGLKRFHLDHLLLSGRSAPVSRSTKALNCRQSQEGREAGAWTWIAVAIEFPSAPSCSSVRMAETPGSRADSASTRRRASIRLRWASKFNCGMCPACAAVSRFINSAAVMPDWCESMHLRLI